MTERLTKKHDNSIYGNDGCMSGCDTCSWCECRDVHKMIAKLAHYEDLEEQGRLVVLPEELDKDTFSKHLAMTACPAFVGLKDWQGTEKCKDTTECCKECWEKALKGEKL